MFVRKSKYDDLLKDYPIAILSKNHNVKVYENGIESKNITHVVFHCSADSVPTLEMKKVG